MTILKKHLKNFFVPKVGALPINFLLKVTNQKMILPFYHSISDYDLPHISHLYPLKNSKNFIDDLDFLLRHFDAVDFFEFKRRIENNLQSKKPFFLLSFDDGLSQFFDVIAPILIKKGIPATCFLNSNFVDNKALFYRYKASLLIDCFQKQNNLLKKQSIFKGSYEEVKMQILSTQYHQQAILDLAAEEINFSFDLFLENEKPYLSSKQIKKLIQQGFHFGAHSEDHPEYQFISKKEQLAQTKNSMNSIQQNFELDYKIFSFPFTDFGVSKDFFEQLKKKKIVDYSFGCAGQKKESIANHFQRIAFEKENWSAKEILQNELNYYMIKAILGKNKIYRK